MGKAKCHLCKQNDVYEIKSHFTPAVITENTFGKRNAEEIYTIDSEKKVTDKYVGPENPQKEVTEVKPAPNVRRGVFCKQCEERFGRLEDKCQAYLNEVVNSLGKRGYNIKRTTNGAKYIDLKLTSNTLSLFYYTIVWRQCLEQHLDHKDLPLGEDEFEKLRKVVLENVDKSEADLDATDFSKYPNVVLFTTYNTSSADTATFVNPHPIVVNPELFFAGPINILYWKDAPLTEDIEKKILIVKSLIDEELNISGTGNSRIAIINNDLWQKISKVLAEKVADQFLS